MQGSEDSPNVLSKKIPLEDLSQEELVKRCKSLISIAQKAKAARDDVSNKLEEALGKLSTMRECAEKSELENNQLSIKCEELENQVTLCKNELLERDKVMQEVQRAEAEAKLLTNQNAELENHVKMLESLNAELKAKLEACGETSGVKELESEIQKLGEELGTLKRENSRMQETFESQKAELVLDMNEMNNALKQRGETITHLHERLRNQESLFESKIRELQDQLEDRQKRIAELENEVSQHGEHNDTMSTSTVSRVEEIHRMRDVEDSLEERYNKLKMLAVKMKKKISEQNSIVEELRSKLLQLTKEKENLTQLSKNTQALLKDVDRLQDEVEEKTKQNRVLKKDLEEAINNLATSKQFNEEAREETSRLKSAITGLEKTITALEESVKGTKQEAEQWKKEKEAEKLLRAEIGKECSALKNEVASLNAKLAEMQQESSKRNVLDLEIDDFERTIEDLKTQLETKSRELSTAEDRIKEQNEKNEGLGQQINFLEDQSKSEHERAENLKRALEETHSQLTSCLELQKYHELELVSRQTKLETMRQQMEKLQLEFAETSAKSHKGINSLTSQNEHLRSQVSSLEENMAAKQKELDQWHSRYQETAAEFDSYKIRAQSVLKQAREKGRNEAEVSDPATATEHIEKEMLQRVIDALKEKVAELQAQATAYESDIQQLKAERDRAVEAELRAVRATEQRTQQLGSELETARTEYKTSLARMQADHQLLASLHKDQLEAMSSRHAKEVDELQLLLDQSQVEIVRLQRQLNPMNVENKTGNLFESSKVEKTQDPEESLLPIPVETKAASRKPLPLDLLLSTPMDTEERDGGDEDSRKVDQKSLEEAREAALVAERRCRHLGSLLAEAEANEARLSQLSEALKEEIRRNQRAEERQKHIENLEYLKNVILKFVMLPRGEERSRLVPVLTTLLKLSPSEVHQLNNTVQRAGAAESLAARPAAAAAAAWGGIFHLWSGPS